MPTLERAIELAAKTLAGQTDKTGKPFILQPLQHMLDLKTNDERIVAILQSVIRGSSWTLSDLEREGFSGSIINAAAEHESGGDSTNDRRFPEPAGERKPEKQALDDLRQPGSFVIYTDGSALKNPGPGGWGYVVLQNDQVIQELADCSPQTTNNIMELAAAINALASLPFGSDCQLHTDSEYVKKGITEWIKGWKKRRWKTSAGAPVKNKLLWQELDTQNQRINVTWHWVKAHAGNRWNERADDLARQAAIEQRRIV